MLYYSAFTNEGAIAYGANVAAVLSDADISAIEAAFSAPESDDPYVHVVNGIKQLLVRVFDGGDFSYPTYSYVAEYLRDPNSELDGTQLPDTRVFLLGDDRQKEAQCIYLGNEIGRYAGISVDLLIVPDLVELHGSTVRDVAELYRTGGFDDDPETTVVLACDPESSAAAFAASEAVAMMLPDDAETRLISAMLEADGDDYDRAIAGLEELARILYADGTREYSEFSGIALALDPDAFAESSGVPVAVWIALAVVLLAAALLAVGLRRRKKRLKVDETG